MYPFIQRFAEGGDASADSSAFSTAAGNVSQALGLDYGNGVSPFASASNQVVDTLGVSPNRFAQAPVMQGGIGALSTTPTSEMQKGLGALTQAAPMYTKHEGMLFGDDFYDRYAQNRGGQYADPYHNYLMTTAKVIGPNADIANLYKQYQASGRTDTPDWATVDTTGPISVIPKLAHYWDASGANPVDQLSSAWNPTTPLAEGVTVPEGYWDNVLAYNMNLSKAHPSLMLNGTYTPDSVKNNNLVAKYALDNNIYDIDHPAVVEFSKTLARKGAVGDAEVGILQRQYAQYLRDQELAKMYGR